MHCVMVHILHMSARSDKLEKRKANARKQETYMEWTGDGGWEMPRMKEQITKMKKMPLMKTLVSHTWQHYIAF